tara:strand:+ start:9657 stop:9863 length:207 start_codon:yes stop_codon:yes gene_type:complete
MEVDGIKAQGRKELKKYLIGEKITFKQAVLAKCYECMCGYNDGKVSCEIPECPLYRFMPYKGTKQNDV